MTDQVVLIGSELAAERNYTQASIMYSSRRESWLVVGSVKVPLHHSRKTGNSFSFCETSDKPRMTLKKMNLQSASILGMLASSIVWQNDSPGSDISPSSSINPLWLKHPTTPSYTPGFKASTINTLAGLAFSGHSDQCGYPVQWLLVLKFTRADHMFDKFHSEFQSIFCVFETDSRPLCS